MTVGYFFACSSFKYGYLDNSSLLAIPWECVIRFYISRSFQSWYFSSLHPYDYFEDNSFDNALCNAKKWFWSYELKLDSSFSHREGFFIALYASVSRNPDQPRHRGTQGCLYSSKPVLDQLGWINSLASNSISTISAQKIVAQIYWYMSTLSFWPKLKRLLLFQFWSHLRTAYSPSERRFSRSCCILE